MQNRRGEGVDFGPITEPGRAAGDCPECGGSTVMVGHGSTVVGTFCEECDLLVGLGVDYLDVHDAYDDPHPPGEPTGDETSSSEG